MSYPLQFWIGDEEYAVLESRPVAPVVGDRVVLHRRGDIGTQLFEVVDRQIDFTTTTVPCAVHLTIEPVKEQST